MEKEEMKSRPKHLRMDLSVEAHTELKNRATQQGVTMSDYVRAALGIDYGVRPYNWQINQVTD